MQTNIIKNILNPELTLEADKILRSCVHCGFCTATCPTYQLFSDELDGPRGRIYLVKQMLEGQEISDKTVTHLDRCLTCRSCETTCPSGVQYSRLLDIGRTVAEQKFKRPLFNRILRKSLLSFMLSTGFFKFSIQLLQPFSFIFPKKLKAKIKIQSTDLNWPGTQHNRKVILLTGCAQDTFAPVIDKQLAHLLDRCGFQVEVFNGCCGALPQHMAAEDKATSIMTNNIDRWKALLDTESNIEAIIMSSSGCGVTLKEYNKYLQYDKNYASEANRISALVKDPVELLEANIDKLTQSLSRTLSFHAPCTLQHGLRVHTKVESLLTQLGYQLNIIKDSHLCCGSAGSYSIFQPDIAGQLLKNKITCLEENQPDIIASSNIGCLMHLNTASKQPVKHWISVVFENLKKN